MGASGGRVMPNQGGAQVSVEVINNLGAADVKTERSTAPDGRQVYRVILNNLKADLGSGGELSKSIGGTFGLSRAPGLPRRDRT